jgi:hypothetical protein
LTKSKKRDGEGRRVAVPEYGRRHGTLKLEIVTPEAKIFSDDVDMVTLTGIDGEMGILPQHMPLMTQLVAGEIIARKEAERFSSPSATALCRSPATAWPC